MLSDKKGSLIGSCYCFPNKDNAMISIGTLENQTTYPEYTYLRYDKIRAKNLSQKS